MSTRHCLCHSRIRMSWQSNKLLTPWCMLKLYNIMSHYHCYINSVPMMSHHQGGWRVGYNNCCTPSTLSGYIVGYIMKRKYFVLDFFIYFSDQGNFPNKSLETKMNTSVSFGKCYCQHILLVNILNCNHVSW